MSDSGAKPSPRPAEGAEHGPARRWISAGLRAEVDAEDEHPVVERRLGVGEHGEVHVVGLGLLHESLAVRPLDRGETAIPDGLGPGPEAGQHLLGVELLGHGSIVAGLQRAQ